MLALAVDNYLIDGIQYPNNGPKVTNIQYVDNTLIFLDPSEEYVINLKRILCCFQTCSGLKINFNKPSITGVGVSKEQLNRFSGFLDCSILPLPIKYLGLSLYFKRSSYNDWAPVLDKLFSRLDTWKARFLSFGGKLTLVNSILSVIPTYYLSVLHLPTKVEYEMDKIQRRFL